MTSEPDLDAAVGAADVVVVVTDHSAYDWDDLFARAALVVDTRHVRPESALAPGAAVPA